MGKEIVIHQAVFGYDAGHHLLASSIPLSPEASHALAVATDLSGSPPPDGFERAVTGMPVSGSGLYALFSTWLAPEMPRPGCVWSHVLLIENAQLSQIPDLGILRQFFNRPSKESGTAGYNIDLRCEPVAEPVDSWGAHDPLAIDCQTAKRLVELLYAPASKPIILTSSTSHEYELLVFRVWSQQWPRLREVFRFSTGSFSDRGRLHIQFDFQVTPEANRRSWLHGSKYVLLDTSERSGASPSAIWVNAVVEDLIDPDLHGFRSFVSVNASDVKPSRAVFGMLAQAFIALRDTPPAEWSAVLTAVARQFPDPHEALTLKRATIRSAEPTDDEASVERAWAALEFLQREAASGPFSEVQDDVVNLVRLVWRSRQSEVADLLLTGAKPSGHPRWIQLAKGVAEAAVPRDLAWIWERNADLMRSLIRLHPTLATQIDVWRLPDRAQWAVVDALESASITPDLWCEIVDAMLTAGTRVAIREVTQAAGQAAFEGALNWTKREDDRLPGDAWRDSLATLAEGRLAQESLSPAELAFAVAFVPSYVAERISPSRSPVQELATIPLGDLPTALRLPTAFFLVALGLTAEASVGVPLLARGFFAVHSALATRTEPPNSWRLLQRHLPEFGWWEWDRCDKLRETTRRWFRRNRGAQSTFLQAADTEADRNLAQRLIS